MSDRHHDLAPLAAAYALGALDADERRAFEEHLPECALCAAEVRSLSRVTTGLAQTVTLVSPRSELRGRILTAVGARLPRAVPEASAPAAAPRPARASAAWLPYAAVLAVAATLAVFAWDQRTRMRALEARLAQAAADSRGADLALIDARRLALESQAAIAVLSAPDLVRVDLMGEAVAPQASARALWSRQRGMVFAATNLPPLPAGRVYQVWVVTDAPAPTSAGLLTPDASGSGVAVFSTPADIAPPKAIAVTIEPAGGMPGPTGDRYLIGAPAAL